MQSPCIAQISPAVVAASQLLSHDSELCNDDFNSVIQRCPLHPEDVSPEELDAMKQEIDDKVLCEVMCCCSNNPCTGSEAGTNQRQGCVSATLQAADEVLNHQSRYKPEISYNMDTHPPSPFMHRDEMGQDNTQKSDRWQTRARQEIPGYRGGQGDVRRPDVIIVKDSSKPPYQENIDRVVEMKFKGDRLGVGQEESYVIIAGDEDRLMLMEEGKDCTCTDNDGELEPVPQPVAIPEEEPSVDWWAVAETTGMAVVTAVAAVATVALVIVPFDGPAGEIAAGTGTAVAAARTAAAFGRIFRAVPH
ncbi:MAG: VRR-NUC domain-containing protein [Methylococcaceae bacterium]|nr:VRR-NUC domain-containing protein [Methylococcaceae bacterium]